MQTDRHTNIHPPIYTHQYIRKYIHIYTYIHIYIKHIQSSAHLLYMLVLQPLCTYKNKALIETYCTQI